MNKIPKKLFSVLLVLAMLVSLVPEQVFAADASNALPTTPSVTRLESAQTVGVEFVPEDEADVSDTDAQQNANALSSDSGGETASEDRQLFDEQNTTQDSTLVDVPVSAELMADGYTSGDYTYTVSNGTAMITGYSGDGGNVSIPSIIGGYSVSGIGAYAFNGCRSLNGVTIPDSVTSIGNYAFYGCISLTDVAIPSGVTRIGSEAFRSCSSLVRVMINGLSCAISESAFANCPNLTLYCPYASLTTIYAIEHDIMFEPSGTFVDNDSYVLDHTRTNLYADINGMSANGYVTITLTYRLKEAWASRISGMAAKVRLPGNLTLDEDTIKMDGVVCTTYTLRDTVLTIPLTNKTGTIKLNAKATQQGKIACYATLTMKKDGSNAEEIVGIVNENAALLTLNLPSETSGNTIAANGLAPASSTVTLYVDGVQNTTVVASKAGNWSAQVTLTNPANNYSYTVSASCPDAGSTSPSSSVVYKEDAASMTGFVLKFNEHSTIKTCDLMNTNGIKPRVYFVPGTEFIFEVSFDHPEQIRKLYVTSTRNGEKKYLEAAYDENAEAFVTHGYFDPSNRNYIPGTISVEYTKNIPSMAVGQSVDWTSLANQSGVNAEDVVSVKEVSDADYKATIDLSSLVADLGDVFIDATISMYDEQTDGNLSDWLGAFEYSGKIASYAMQGINGEDYLLSLDYSDPYTYAVLIHDLSSDTYLKLILDDALNTAEFGSGRFMFLTDLTNTMSNASTVTKLLMNQYEISKEAGELREEVMSNPRLSEDERRAALGKVDEYEFDKSAFTLLTTVLPLIVAAPVGVGATMSAAPLVLFTAIIGVMVACSSLFWDMRVAQIKGDKVPVNWVADPSGYVYNANTLERIADVTATAYYIPYDDTDEFWSNVPTDEQYGVIWNASEYNQENPLLTNSDGKYAWDVPEGWWRVKYEKAGYETTWSDWMTVPPLQTEVNIGMVSNQIDEYAIRLDERSATSAKVCLTNNTGSDANLLYVVAAYTLNGRMIVCNTANASLKTTESANLTISYSAEAEVAEIKAFVLTADTFMPLRAAWVYQV